MENSVRDRNGKVTGYKCRICGNVVQSMWGDVCNQCRENRSENEKLRKTLTELNKENDYVYLENASKVYVYTASELHKISTTLDITPESAIEFLKIINFIVDKTGNKFIKASALLDIINNVTKNN